MFGRKHVASVEASNVIPRRQTSESSLLSTPGERLGYCSSQAYELHIFFFFFFFFANSH